MANKEISKGVCLNEMKKILRLHALMGCAILVFFAPSLVCGLVSKRWAFPWVLTGEILSKLLERNGALEFSLENTVPDFFLCMAAAGMLVCIIVVVFGFFAALVYDIRLAFKLATPNEI